MLTLLLEQAREAGWSGDRIARASLVGGATPRVDFLAGQHQCPHCGQALSRQKSKTRTLLALSTGPLLACEIRKHCRICQPHPVAVPQLLAALVPPGHRYVYDLIVWVGLARYYHHLQREEIRTALARQGLILSASSLSALCDRFLTAWRPCTGNAPPQCARPCRPTATHCTSMPPAPGRRGSVTTAPTRCLGGRAIATIACGEGNSTRAVKTDEEKQAMY